eukprot:scaffold238264_cov44-Tisochrysis_lutea.AAC.2
MPTATHIRSHCSSAIPPPHPIPRHSIRSGNVSRTTNGSKISATRPNAMTMGEKRRQSSRVHGLLVTVVPGPSPCEPGITTHAVSHTVKRVLHGPRSSNRLSGTLS